MKLDELIAVVKEEFPNKAIDISESLELLQETIRDTMDRINDEINNSYTKREFDRAKKYINIGEEINRYEQKIEELIGLLEVDTTEIIDEEQEEKAARILPDYSAYSVNTEVEHTLYEDFTHKRPHGFRINDETVIEVKTWKEMLFKTCELLMALDEEKFMSFENKEYMNGKKRKHFSTNPGGMVDPKLVNHKMYVETNINANGIRNLLLKLLKEYGFKVSEFKIYLRADYTDLHK